MIWITKIQEIERSAMEERSAKIAKKDGLTLEEREKVEIINNLLKILNIYLTSNNEVKIPDSIRILF